MSRTANLQDCKKPCFDTNHSANARLLMQTALYRYGNKDFVDERHRHRYEVSMTEYTFWFLKAWSFVDTTNWFLAGES